MSIHESRIHVKLRCKSLHCVQWCAAHCALIEAFNKALNRSGFAYVNKQGGGIMKCVYKKKDVKSTTGYLAVISFRVRQYKTHVFPK